MSTEIVAALVRERDAFAARVRAIDAAIAALTTGGADAPPVVDAAPPDPAPAIVRPDAAPMPDPYFTEPEPVHAIGQAPGPTFTVVAPAEPWTDEPPRAIPAAPVPGPATAFAIAGQDTVTLTPGATVAAPQVAETETDPDDGAVYGATPTGPLRGVSAPARQIHAWLTAHPQNPTRRGYLATEIAAGTGLHPQTVRKAVDALIAAAVVVKTTPTYQSRNVRYRAA